MSHVKAIKTIEQFADAIKNSEQHLASEVTIKDGKIYFQTLEMCWFDVCLTINFNTRTISESCDEYTTFYATFEEYFAMHTKCDVVGEAI